MITPLKDLINYPPEIWHRYQKMAHDFQPFRHLFSKAKHDFGVPPTVSFQGCFLHPVASSGTLMGWTPWLPSTLGPLSQGFGFGGSGRPSERTTRAGGWQSPAVEVFWGESFGNLEIPKWSQLNTFLKFLDSPNIGGFMIQFDGRIFFSSGLVQPPTRFLFLGSSFLLFFFEKILTACDCCATNWWEGKRWNQILLVYLVK